MEKFYNCPELAKTESYESPEGSSGFSASTSAPGKAAGGADVGTRDSGRPLTTCLRWENRHAARFYEALVQRDLCGSWEVWKRWGALGSHRGGQQRSPVDNEGAGLDELAATQRPRGQRGYVAMQAHPQAGLDGQIQPPQT